jgi:hypothetical protein
MNFYELTGTYTYRSFLNNPEPVDDFNKIAFAEGEMFLFVAPDGTVSGTLAFPADPTADTKDFMDLTGQVLNWATGSVSLEGLGRAGTGTDAYDYKYQGNVSPTFADAVAERMTIAGTVMRAKPHGTAPSGVTASFVAVKRDYLRPRTIPQVALIPDVIQMLASRHHRLQHNTWHTVRMNWPALSKDSAVVAEIDKRGWWPQRPPFRDDKTLILENGAGEDFLYMHRRMIGMVQDMYRMAGKPAPKGWTALPPANAPQLVYKSSPDGKSFKVDPSASGFMVPPPDLNDASDQLMKSPSFLSSTMRPIQALFQSQRWLSGLTLGQLGNLIEWSIHGWMHNRWGDNIVDSSGQPIGRSSLFDIDKKWDDPKNDDLLDFYSSHVHPIFWRLHGWINDRIDDWSTAHPNVRKTDLNGVPWFAVDGKDVLAEVPFSWPGSDHPNNDGDIRTMEEVTAIMQKALQPAISSMAKAAVPLRTARKAIRDTLLGISLPDVPGMS